MKTDYLDDRILAIVCSIFDAYSAVLFLPEESTENCYLAAGFSLGDTLPMEITIAPGNSLAGWIIKNRRPLVVSSFDYSKNSLGYYAQKDEADIKAFMGNPLPTGGALCVDSKRQYSFSEKDSKLLQMFAELISQNQALQSSFGQIKEIPNYFTALGIIQDLRFRYKRWPVFLKNFLQTMSEATKFDYCAFATRQENGDFYNIESESAPLLLTNDQAVRVPLTYGITGWVFANKQVVCQEETASSSALFGNIGDMPDFPAILCLPVIVNKSCRGVLCLANTERRVIDENMRNFASQAVDHLSLFLENLYLKNRLRSFFPKASIQRTGTRIFNPDSAPMPPKPDDDILE